MEIYLSHMVIFRVIEKMNIIQTHGKGWLQYGVMVIVVIAGTTLLAIAMQKIIGKVTVIIEQGMRKL